MFWKREKNSNVAFFEIYRLDGLTGWKSMFLYTGKAKHGMIYQT